MKKCKNCESEVHGRSGLCKPCKNEYNKVWYEQNKDTHKASAKKNNDRQATVIREVVLAAKDIPCADCDRRFDYWKMDFDHLPQFVKSFDIGRAGSRSLRAVSSEIAKCEVVCKLCHADRTRHRFIHKGLRPNARPDEVSVFTSYVTPCDKPWCRVGH